MKKILTFHLRKDLNLRNKWWHRLMLTLYVLAIIFLFILSIGNPDFKFFDYPQWRLVDSVEERLDVKLNTLYQLKKSGEKIDDMDASSYSLNVPYGEGSLGDDFYQDIYCSKNIINYIPEILKKEGINNLESGGGKWVSLEEFNSFLTKNNDKCVIVDSYSNYGGFGGKVYFLRSESSTIAGNFSQEWGFHEVSPIKSFFFFIGNVIISAIWIFIMSYIISVIYHKVILYIVFGKRK